MAEVAIAVVAKILEYSVPPTIRTGYYLFCVGKLRKKLEKEKRKLESMKDDVSQRAEDAKRKTERIENVVEKWLQEAHSTLQDVDKLENEVRSVHCFWNLCPVQRRYHLCKQLERKIERMIELNNNSKFERFSRLASLPTNVEYFSSANFMLFESTKLAYNQLLEAIKDDDCHMVCLYGMGGCGKTTLAKEFGKRAKELNLFDKVVFSNVSHSPNVRRIQGDIADELGLSPLTEEGKDGRARRLSLGMQSEEMILVILDDVWGILNLEDFGIALDGNLKGCKVLLTTRLQHLCTLMNGQRNVPLNLLLQEEAWSFLQKKACIAENSLLDVVAREVVAECKGLPIAIQAIGTTLKGKPLDSWKDALYKLRHSKPVGVPEGVIDAFTCLQYSFDILKCEEAKRLFLMCSIFPEDHEIKRESLFRYGVGLGLFGEAGSFDDLRSRVNARLTYLLDYSLLMHCEGKEDHFKMHDVVRDFALAIASKMDFSVMVDHAKGMNALSSDGDTTHCFGISTWYGGKNDQFPQQLDAPKLEILLLNSNSPLDLSQVSFEGIERLRVMGLVTSFPLMRKIKVSLPQSTMWLTNLRTLRLVGCDLGDISFVVCLKRLEILELKKSKFKLLPIGIQELNKLKLLDLRYCTNIGNCDEVIIRCSQLEELYAYRVATFSGNQIIDSRACIFENVSFTNLQRYILQMGRIKKHIHFLNARTQVLHLGELNIPYISVVVKDLIQRVEYFHLENLHGGCKSIFPELAGVVGSMNHLIQLSLYSCSEIEFFICSTPAQAYCFQVGLAFPMLVQLWLCDMDKLKLVCHGPLPPNIFQNLTEASISNCCQLVSIFPGECNLCNLKLLHISDCPMLKSLFSVSVAQTLLRLENMKIRRCSELKRIILVEGQSDATRREGLFEISESSDFMFPKLKALRVSNCDKLEYLLRIPSAQGPAQLLEELVVESCDQLKFIIFNEEDDGATTREQRIHVSENASLTFPKIVFLAIRNCDKLEYVFPIYCAQGLVQLQNLEVANASQMKYVFGKSADEDLSTYQNKIQILFPQLKELYLQNLTSLVKICSGNCYPTWPSLKAINWFDCPIFTNLGSLEVETAGCERSNEVLYIKNCGVINIFHLQGDRLINDHQELAISKLKRVELENLPELSLIWIGLRFSQPLSLSFLKSISLQQCGKLKCVLPTIIHPILPSLTDLVIYNCENLEEIFAEHGELQNTCRVQDCFPNLERLNVTGCPKLKVVFSIGMARRFSQLKTISISEASELKEIFGCTNEDLSNNEKEILVPNLREIILKKLPNLIDICQGFNLLAPELHKVQIHECPKFAPIPEAARYWRKKGLRIAVVNGGPLSVDETPTLPIRVLFSKKLDSCGVIDMFQIDGSVVYGEDQHLQNSKVVKLGPQHEIWTGPIPSKMLNPQYLRSLTVRRCRKLKSLFPWDVIHDSLPELGFLSISDCEELEEIIEEKGEQHNGLTAKVSGCFRKLGELVVERCNKLKRLFPASIARELPQLEILYISEAAELKEVFSSKNEGSINNDGQKIMLPNLTMLTLLQLPCLVGLRNELKISHAIKYRILGCSNSGFLEGQNY